MREITDGMMILLLFERRWNRVALFVGVVLALAQPERAQACPAAPLPNEDVYTQYEQALIVWDQAQHLEHFVRAADFIASGDAFGFLVPTPARPELAEVDDAVFEELNRLTAPSTVHEKKLAPFPIGCTMLPLMLRARRKDAAVRSASAAADAVQVVGQARVAGLDAITLESTDASALANWLNAHGFAFRDALKRWVAPYLARHFSITVFRYAPSDAGSTAPVLPSYPTEVGTDGLPLPHLPVPGNAPQHTRARVGSRAVRLTFRAPAPFYPYREPDDVPAVDSRNLRLLVIDTAPVVGSFDDSAKPWSVALPFSARVRRTDALRQALPGVELPDSFWLSDYSDDARKRPAADLVFGHAQEQREVRRPPNVVADEIPLPIPYELPFVGALWLWSRRRRRVRRARRSGA